MHRLRSALLLFALSVGCRKSVGDVEPGSVPSAKATASASAASAREKAPPPALGMLYAQVNGKCIVPPTDTQSPVPPEPLHPGASNACEKDAECTKGKNPRCRSVYMGHGMSHKACTADACEKDADCAAGTGCFCGGAADGRNACIPYNCRSNADCETGYVCGLAGMSGGRLHPPAGSFCRTSRDTCADDGDCGSGNAPGAPSRVCDYVAASHRFECVATHYPPPG